MANPASFCRIPVVPCDPELRPRRTRPARPPFTPSPALPLPLLLLLILTSSLAPTHSADGPAPAPGPSANATSLENSLSAPGPALAPPPEVPAAQPPSTAPAPAPALFDFPLEPTTETGLPEGYVFIDCATALPLNNSLLKGSRLYKPSMDVPQGTATYALTSLSGRDFPAHNPEKNLRAFLGGGCYNVSVGQYSTWWSVRMGFGYHNYDNKHLYPNFTVTINDMLMDVVALEDWEERQAWDTAGTIPGGGLSGLRELAFTEYQVNVSEPWLNLCFEAVTGNPAPPVVSSIEIVPWAFPEMEVFQQIVDPGATEWGLALKHRYNLGGTQISVTEDPRRRRWAGQNAATLVEFQTLGSSALEPRYMNISNTSAVPPTDFDPPLPPNLFTHAAQGGPLNSSNPQDRQVLAVRFNYWPLLPTNMLVAKLYFIELNEVVFRPGQRVFNVSFAAARYNDTTQVQALWWPTEFSIDVDLFKIGTSSANVPVMLPFLGCNPNPRTYRTNTSLFLFLESYNSDLPPILSGVELFEVVNSGANETCPTLSQQDTSITYTKTPIASPEPTGPELSDGAIFGIVAAGLLIIVSLAALIMVFMRRRAAGRRDASFRRFQSERI